MIDSITHPTILGPEACLNNVDFVERFFRYVGCDFTPHAFNRRYAQGKITFDRATQTLPYPAALLSTNIIAGPVSSAPMSNSADHKLCHPPVVDVRLGVSIITESTNKELTRQNKLRFICGQNIKRSEFHDHYETIHSNVHSSLNGWFEQRCPYAAYGCTFSEVRLLPNSGRDVIVHDADLSVFTVKNIDTPTVSTKKLSSLPNSILVSIFRNLDSYTLYQMTKVSRKCRLISLLLLQEKGTVTREWRKQKLLTQTGEKVGGYVWRRASPKWEFSKAFGKVSKWTISDRSLAIGSHLQNDCQFAKRSKLKFLESYSNPIGLPIMSDWNRNLQ